MSILINGMEMPKDDEWYEISIFPNGEVCRTNWQGDQTLIKGVTAVPVQPHGRLGDLDEMFLEFVEEGQKSKRYKLGEKWELNGEEIREVINRLPTVILPVEDYIPICTKASPASMGIYKKAEEGEESLRCDPCQPTQPECGACKWAEEGET